jgi:hypothetical protein
LFIPKIVRWGIRFGATNEKYGKHFKAMQWGSGGSNSHSYKRHGGKVYSNLKQDRIGRAKLFSDLSRKGVKRHIR